VNLPGFSGDSSLYRSNTYYQTTSLSGDVAGSPITMALPIRNGGGNGGPRCHPHCDPCTSSIDSPTGCGKSCRTADCEPNQQACTGCANPCEGGQFCNGICTDTSSDLNNCGGCGHVCASGLMCSNGVCACAPGLTFCNGICTNTSSDQNNCGTCGNSCGTDPCLGGLCPPPCPGRLQPYPWCGAPDAAMGCPCLPGLVCRSRLEPDHIMSFDRYCQPPLCIAGQTLCGTTCSDLTSDPMNCGACGTSCGPGWTCSNANCVCRAGRTVCGTTCADLTTDPTNCGSCGNSCAPGLTCVNGSCVKQLSVV
jgi:hypothetical protein